MLIHANPQLGPVMPIDIYEDSQDGDDGDDADDYYYEPTASVAPAASDAPTAAPAPSGYRPPLVIGRALDVLNAPGSTREELQTFFRPRNLGPGDIEALSPEPGEELRLENAAAQYELLGSDQAEKEAQGTSQVFDKLPGLSEAWSL